MLRSNSKQARENIKNYILENFEPSNYYDDFWGDIEKNRKSATAELDRFSFAAHAIYDAFYNEILKHDKRYKAHQMSEQDAFEYWCGGLPPILDTCYYYNRSAVKDLGDILEETETERNRFAESEAEHMLTYLIFREIKRVVK